MKLRTWTPVLLAAGYCFLVGCTPPPEDAGTEPEPEPEVSVGGPIEPLSGGDLTGFSMDPELWKLRDGVVVGTTTDEEPVPYNKFLIWEDMEVADFELEVEMKMTGENNSGIQYRSVSRPDLGENVVGGYQMDMHPNPDYLGMLYDEKGRGIVATRGQKVAIMPDGKKMQIGTLEDTETKFDLAEWNTYTVRAEGNKAIHMVNGITTAEIIDLQEEERELSGKIAFQVHRGPAMQVEIRNMKVTPLPGGAPVLTLADLDIPEDAKQVHAPKPRPPKKPKPEAKKPAAEAAKPAAEKKPAGEMAKPAEKKKPAAEKKPEAPAKPAAEKKAAPAAEKPKPAAKPVAEEKAPAPATE